MTSLRHGIVVASLSLAFVAPAEAALICTGNCNIGTNVQVGSNNAGDGSLAILGGEAVSVGGAGFIGSFGVNSGTATVSGTGSRMDIGGTSNSQLFIGVNGGTGSLSIIDNGTVTSNAFNNAPNFGDARAYIGSAGTGTVNVGSGGSLIVRDTGPYGADDGIQLGVGGTATPGNGVLNVDGTGSVVVRGNLAFINVGQANTLFSGPLAGTGQLNVTNGGSVLIDGTTSTGLLSVGRGGNSSGTVTVSGANSRIDLQGQTASIVVANDLTQATGNTGVGVLHVAQGGVVATKAVAPVTSLTIGFGLGSGLVVVDNGGTLDLDGTIRVSRNSATNGAQTGVLLIKGTGVVNATNTFVGNGTNPAVNGILAGTGTLNSNVFVQTGGLLDPGLSPGTLTIGGDITFTGGALKIELAGSNHGEFDVVEVLGVADLASGFIEFAFIDGFLPKAGDIFDFLLADAIVGLSSAAFSYSGLADGFQFEVSVVGEELRVIALNDGMAVPEPGTLALLVLGVAGLVAARRREQ